MRRLIIWLFALGTILIVSMGCYTVLNHPGAGSEEGVAAHNYQQDCLDCHSDYHEYPYGYFYSDYPDYWWDSPRYGKYYAYPWWWDYYWSTEKSSARVVSDDSEDTPSVRPEGKKVSRRDNLRPPYSSGIPSIGRDNFGSGGSSGGGTVSGSAGSSSGGSNSTGSSSSESKTKKSDENKNKGKKKPRTGSLRNK